MDWRRRPKLLIDFKSVFLNRQVFRPFFRIPRSKATESTNKPMASDPSASEPSLFEWLTDDLLVSVLLPFSRARTDASVHAGGRQSQLNVQELACAARYSDCSPGASFRHHTRRPRLTRRSLRATPRPQHHSCKRLCGGSAATSEDKWPAPRSRLPGCDELRPLRPAVSRADGGSRRTRRRALRERGLEVPLVLLELWRSLGGFALAVRLCPSLSILYFSRLLTHACVCALRRAQWTALTSTGGAHPLLRSRRTLATKRLSSRQSLSPTATPSSTTHST